MLFYFQEEFVFKIDFQKLFDLIKKNFEALFNEKSLILRYLFLYKKINKRYKL